jgi:hypothetical protein
MDVGRYLQIQVVLLQDQPVHNLICALGTKPLDGGVPAVTIDVDEAHQVTQGDDAHIAQALDDRAGKPGFQPVGGCRDG